jgi:transposase
MLAETYPRAPVIVVICDNDSIHHARAVTRYLERHPRLELMYGARYSPHDNPVEIGLPQCGFCRASCA